MMFRSTWQVLRFLVLSLGMAVLQLVPLQAQQVTSTPLSNQLIQNPLSLVTTARKVQCIYTPADFNIAIPNGVITHLYLRSIGMPNGNLQFANLSIRMGTTSQSTFTSNLFIDSLSPVLDSLPNRSFGTVNVVGNYLRVPLDMPFAYQSGTNLVIEVSATQSNGGFTATAAFKANKRLFSAGAGDTVGTIDNLQWSIGLDVLTPVGDDIRLTQAQIAPLLQEGANPLTVQFQNFGLDTLRQLQLGYSWGGNQVVENWTGTLLTGQSAQYTFAQPPVGQRLQSGELKAWLALPNGVTDTLPQNDSLQFIRYTPWSAGPVRIGGAGADFPSLAAAEQVLRVAGMTGPIQLQLASGTRADSLFLELVPGLNSTNSLTIESLAGQADSVWLLSSTVPVLRGRGLANVVVRNLSFKRSGAHTAGFGALRLENCVDWTLENNKVDVDLPPFAFPVDSHACVFLSTSRNITLRNSTLSGGQSGLIAVAPAGNTVYHDIQVDSCRFDSLIVFYVLSHIRGFRFTNNAGEVFDTSTPGLGAVMRHSECAGVHLARNQLTIRRAVRFLEFTQLRTISQQANLVVNNLFLYLPIAGQGMINVGLSGVGNNNKIDFLHNTFLIQPNTVVMAGTNYIQLANGWNNTAVSAIRNNVFVMRGPATLDAALFGFGGVSDTAAFRRDYNLYDLPNPVRYARLSTARLSLTDVQFAGTDLHSAQSSMELDAANNFRLRGSANSRFSQSLPAVTQDFVGQPRNQPWCDAGAYEGPQVLRPAAYIQTLSDTDRFVNRTVFIQVRTDTPTVTSANVQLFYKRPTDSIWLTTPATQIAGERYQAVMDVSRLSLVFGPGTIQYYVAIASGGDTVSLPTGGDFNQAPPTFYSVNHQESYGGTYTVGQQGDFTTLTQAATRLSGRLVLSDVRLVLLDSLYANESSPILLQNTLYGDPSYGITIQPAPGVHARFTDGQLSPPRLTLRSVQRVSILGRDSLGGGSIQFHSALPQSSAMIRLERTSSGPTTDVTLRDLVFSSANAANQTTGIAIAGTVSSNLTTGIRILGCRFEDLNTAIFADRVLDLRIDSNWIEGAPAVPMSNPSTAMNLVLVDTLVVSRNVVRDRIQEFTGAFTTVLAGITLSGPTKFAVLANNHISNIGYADTMQSTFAGSPAPIIGIDIARRHDSLLIIGNHISNIVNSRYDLGIGFITFRVIGIRDLQLEGINVVPRTTYAHNTILMGRPQALNSRLISHVMQLENAVDRKFYNNVFSETTRGNPQLVASSIYLSSQVDTNLLRQLTLNHNLIIRDSLQPAPYFSTNQARTNLIPDLAAWRNFFLGMGNPQEQVALHTLRAAAPYVGLQPDTSITPFLQNNALPIPLPPLAMTDIQGTPRPGFGSTLADIGALEVPGTQQIDARPPQIQNLQIDSQYFACAPYTRTFRFDATDATSVATAFLRYHPASVAPPVNFFLMSGTPLQGRWAATIPVGTTNQRYGLSLIVEDALGNQTVVDSFISYGDYVLDPVVSLPSVVPVNSVVQGSFTDSNMLALAITEINFNRNGLGQTDSFPPGIPNDLSIMIELTNYGSDTVDVSGYELKTSGQPWFTFPAGTSIAPRQVAVIGITSAPSNPAANFFTTTFFPILSSSNASLTLHAANAAWVDAVVFNNGPPQTGPSAFLIPTAMWEGDGLELRSGAAALVLRKMDLNGPRHWVSSSVDFPATLGRLNPGLVIKPTPQILWTGPISGTTNPAQSAPLAAGYYYQRFELSTGSCSRADSFIIIVTNLARNQFLRIVDVVQPAAGSTVGTPLQVVARVRNEGVDTIHSFNLGYFTGQTIAWQESFTSTLLPGEYLNVPFSQYFERQTTAGQQFCVYAQTAYPDTLCINLGPAVSVGELNSSALKLWVYPNPVDESLQIRWDKQASQAEIKVLDLRGRLVLQQWYNGELPQLALDVAMLNPGMYILEVRTDGVYGQRRFVVNR